MAIYVYAYSYGNVSINLCPGPYPWKKAQTSKVMKIFAGEEALAAAIKKNKDLDNKMIHIWLTIFNRKKAHAAAVR